MEERTWGVRFVDRGGMKEPKFRAYGCSVDEGILVFRDEDLIVLWAFAPGTWKEVRLVGPEEK